MTSSFTAADRSVASYRFWYDDLVRFNDLDVLGHVTSGAYHTYFTGARAKMFDSAITEWAKSPVVPVIKSTTIDYESELHHPAVLRVGMRIESFGTTSATLTGGLFVGDTCKALCRMVFVFIDTATRKAVPVPPAMRQRFEDLLG